MRAGAYGLSLLADPLDARVLQELENGPLPLIELRQAAGLPPQTTLRKHLKNLDGLGLLVRTQPREFPSAVTYELSTAGLELRAVAKLVETWLAASPSAERPPAGPTTKRTIRSLVDGWTTTMLRPLVARPLSLTELDRVLPGVDYPALERRLTAMRLAGLVEALREGAGSTRYRVTRWLREAVGPLVVSADWECRNEMTDSEPLDRVDVETIFLLAIPLVRLPQRFNGTCELVVDFTDESKASSAGVAVRLNQGRPVSCTSLRHVGGCAAVGSRAAWLSALSGSDEVAISFEGDRALARALFGALRSLCSSRPAAEVLVV